MTATKLTNRIICLTSRRTSMRLCVKEWEALKEICRKEKITRNQLVDCIDKHRSGELGLSYATRLFITNYFWNATTEAGHRMAGHGLNDNHHTITVSIKKLFNS